MIYSVPQRFADSLARHRERPAIKTEDGLLLSYQQLDDLRWQATRALMASGIGADHRVAIWAPNCLEWIVAGLAIHSLGAVLVPINTRLRGEEAAFILRRSGASLLFCSGQFLGQDYLAMIQDLAPPSLRESIVLGGNDDTGASWKAFLSRAQSIEQSAAEESARAVRPDQLMDLLFTSGTTGQPKAVMTTHDQNLRAIETWSQAVGLEVEDRYLIVNPFFHAFGYKVGWLGGLLAGLCIYPHAVFDPKAVLRRIAAERITVLPGPPTLLQGLLDDPDRSKFDLSCLSKTITGAATISPTLIERLRSELGFGTVLTGYGLTESCGVASLCAASDDAHTIAHTSGKAIAGTEMRCVDADNQPVGTNEPGEIVLRGYHVMQGYLDDAEATAAAIDADGWLHTGDIGSLDERGYLRITDRLKDMYIAGGFNCYPAEIERILAMHPAIAQSAVIGIPDGRLGEVGKACVVLHPGHSLDVDELIAWCRQHMANYKVPRQIHFQKELPLNASGKILKFKLREAAQSGANRS